MRSVRKVVFAVLALTALGASVASAQRRPAQRVTTAEGYWELGTDAALSFDLDSPRTTTLNIPVGVLRAGYFTTPQLSIEPFFSLNHNSTEGGASATVYQLGVGVPYHLSPDRVRSQMFVRPFLSLVGFSADPGGAAPSTSDSDIGLGVGFGMKWPKLSGRMAWRGEVNLARFLDAEQTSINLMFGVSFFTR